MINKFILKFREFASNEHLEDLSDEAKVALFEIYLNTIKPAHQPNNSNSDKAPNQSRVRRPNRVATYKQKNYIKRLQQQGKLDDDIDVEQLTVGEASKLIDKGINTPVKYEPEEEPKSEFTGSYNHESGHVSSSDSW